MYNLIEYSDNCLKTSGSLWKYCRNESFLKSVTTIISFATTTFKQKLTGQAAADAKKDVEIVALKYLYNFWRNLEMTLINCEINLILTLSEKCVTSFGTVVNQSATFEITDTKLYVPLVTLSTQDNANFFQQLKSGFKRTINWYKYNIRMAKLTVRLLY